MIRRIVVFVALMAVSPAVSTLEQSTREQSAQAPSRDELLAAMKKATTFMVDTVAYRGGYVWAYLPDRSRRWGELEARETMIWIQPPGTTTMGHLFLDAYHATREEYYYRAAEQVAGALIWGQHPSGGWNYVVDFAGDRSLRDWYDTVGRNGWRLEEFQHYWGNATFDDAGTIDAAKFLLRLYVEKRDPRYKPSLDKALQFVLDSQYPIGAWPQRFPRAEASTLHGKPDYTSYLTFNDDVAAENIDFLLMCHQALGDARVLDPITRAMNAFLVTQQGPPQPGWALQYTPDLKPAGARSYEPLALATHTTAANIGLLLRFHRLTGDTKFLARIPEALDWLDGLRLPPGVAPEGRTHPTFVEIGTNRPLYVHREGSNVVNGRYFVDYDPKNTIGHYSAFRPIDVADLRNRYAAARASTPEDVSKDSPLRAGAGATPLPRYFAVAAAGGGPSAASVITGLTSDGVWLAPLGNNSHPFTVQGSPKPVPGDFSRTYVGDDTDTSPYPDATLMGISLDAYIRNIGVLIRALDARSTGEPPEVVSRQPSAPPTTSSVVWTLDNLERIGGHDVTRVGTPRLVDTPIGPAVEFNGTTDGLMLDVNPLQGLSRFTIEVTFEPAVDGSEEQRFLHIQETGSDNRALIELRLQDATFALDTYLRHGMSQLTLLEPRARHPAARWHVAALTYDGRTMAHYVDRAREATGAVRFAPLDAGRTSVGMRQNRVSWFKGRIRLVRITPDALQADRLLAPPAS